MDMQKNLRKVQEANRKKSENEDMIVQLLLEISDKLDTIIKNTKK